MQNRIAEITKTVAAIKGCQFASLTYLTKKTKELARYTVEIGFSYHTAVEKSVLELHLLIRENKKTWTPLQRLAAARVMKSLRKTLAAHARGEQNEDYTKKNQYIPIANGLNVNTTDNTIQLFGLLRSKVTIKEGEYKAVKSAPLTVEQNKLRKQLPVSNFREFALDLGNIAIVRANGKTLEIEPSLDQFKDLGFDLTDLLCQRREAVTA